MCKVCADAGLSADQCTIKNIINKLPAYTVKMLSMQSYASATGSRSETTFKLKWGQLNIYAHSTGEYTMAPDEPWAERKYSQGLPPGKVKGFRAQDVVAAPTECTMEGYLEGRDYVPVEHGKQEVMDIVPFLLAIAKVEGRLPRNCPTPARLKSSGRKFAKISFGGADDYVFALPCKVTGKQKNREMHLKLKAWVALRKKTGRTVARDACHHGPHFVIDYPNMRFHHRWWWEQFGVFNATMRMMRVGRVTANAIIHINASNGVIDDSIYENVKELAGWAVKMSARPYLRMVKSVLWDDHAKRCRRHLLKDTWNFRLKMPQEGESHVKWDARTLKDRPEERWYLATEPYDSKSRINVERNIDGVLLCDTVAMEVEQSLLSTQFVEWERAAEAKIASKVAQTNKAIESLLVKHKGNRAAIKAMLKIQYLGRQGSYIRLLDKVKVKKKLKNEQRAKIFAHLRARNTAIRERGEQRAARFRRQGWKTKVNLEQFGFGSTGRSAF